MVERLGAETLLTMNYSLYCKLFALLSLFYRCVSYFYCAEYEMISKFYTF